MKHETQEDVDRQVNAMFRDALVGSLMEREARASVALDHDPKFITLSLPDEYEKCSIIELPDVGAVFYTEHHDGDGFVMGGLGFAREALEHGVAELASYTDSGVLYVRYRFPKDDLCEFFSTNGGWVVWA